MNWLSPKPTKSYWKVLSKYSANNEMCKIVVNAKESKERWLKFLGIKDKGNFRYIPDIYDTNVPFLFPRVKKEKYVFTGGFTNRDWAFLTKIAQKLPNIKFVAVGLKNVIEAEIREVPNNMKIFYQLEPEKYYALMEKATVITLPLKEKNVSGFINIIRAAQNGQLCCCTRFKFIEPYFPEERKSDLLENDLEMWVSQLKNILSMTNGEYIAACTAFQNHIKHNFAPERAFKVLYDCWK